MATSRPSAEPTTGWVGVIVFGATVMVMLAIFNIIQGILAIGKNDVFVQSGGDVVIWDVSTWGWIHLVLGILLAVTGVALFKGSVAATVTAIVLVILNASAQMLFLPVYPFWSMIVIAVDLLVLWALTFHGSEMRS